MILYIYRHGNGDDGRGGGDQQNGCRSRYPPRGFFFFFVFLFPLLSPLVPLSFYTRVQDMRHFPLPRHE